MAYLGYLDGENPPPLVFANKVVQQFANNFLGDTVLKPNDYTVIRTTFRKLGGSWFELCHGNIDHLLMLSKVVKAWGEDAKH